MAKYWVGGTGTWDTSTTTNWAASSGGASGAAVPTASDDVFFDGNSGTGTCTINASVVCNSIQSSGSALHTLTHNAYSVTIGSSTAGASNIALDFSGFTTYTANLSSSIQFSSTSTTTQTVNFAGMSTGTVGFTGSSRTSGMWQYTGSHSMLGTFQTSMSLTKGYLDINGQTCSWTTFSCYNNPSLSQLKLGAASITLTRPGSGFNPWDFADGPPLFNCGTSTITFAGTGLNGTFRTGSQTFYNIVFSGSGSLGFNQSIYNSPYYSTFNNLTFTGSADKTDTMGISGGNIVVNGTLAVNGNSATNRVLLQSYTTGTAYTITANGTNSFSNVDFEDITGAGTASWNLSAITGNSGDCGGNSGITFTTSASQTWSGTSGGNWSTNAWSSRVPLPQDDVVVNATFTSVPYGLQFDGSQNYVSTTTQYTNPTTFSIVVWFNTTTTSGGKLVGFGGSQTGSSSNYDRHIYMTNNGEINFGVYTGSTVVITSAAAYNDGNPHLAVATLSSGGMQLYVDSAPVVTNANTSAQSFSGYWRMAYDNLAGWPGSVSSDYFKGDLDNVHIYSRVLSSSEVSGLLAGTEPSTTSLVSWWKFADGSGTTASDSSGNNNTGNLQKSLGSYAIWLSELLSTVTADMPRLGRSINWTGTTGAPTWGFTSTTNTSFGSITLISGMTLSGSQGLTLAGRSSYTLTSAGNQYPQSVGFINPNGTYTLQDNFSTTSSLSLHYGTLNSNNHNVTCDNFSTTSGQSCSLTMSTSTWTLTGTGSGEYLWVSDGLSSGSLSAASSTITIANATGNSRIFWCGSGLTWGILNYIVSGSTGTLQVLGANTTFGTINFYDASAARTLQFQNSQTYTITGAFNVYGTSTNLISFSSSNPGAHTINKSSGVTSCNYLAISYSSAGGGATWYAGAGSTSGASTSGWIFTAPPLRNNEMMGVG